MGPATKTVTLEGRFQMHRAGHLESPTMAYETWGELNESRSNGILIFSGLSPSAHAASSAEDHSAGWWEDMIGPGLPLDSNRYHIICVNTLGSCFGSTGPASVDPATGEIYRLRFPTLTLEDVAEAAYGVVCHLGIEQLDSVIGCSMGGMSGLAYCVRHPGAARRFISISSATRALPFAIAVRSLQREMIRSDPKWMNGNYDPKDPPITGQRLARKLGMMSYRSPEEWNQRFGRQRTTATEENVNDPFKIAFSVEAYLENHANKFSGGFDPNCYLYLSRASDLFDLAEHGGSLESGFSKLRLERALVIGVVTDILFPLQQQRDIAAGLSAVCPNTRLVELDCIRGHDSFLVDMDAFRPVICDFFETCGP
ncbi:MAG: homoserine O-acetyltransferase [Gammaproteobacteria bacterium]|nr:homoserine O-acetyltransferase [Gammaproteobacteria bacterium]MDH3372488.1 homoserine O-acetyltransferase [Gammaproteobacteria bacterium]MDH3409568.1 homoserine O-acetyltransferase [Gammaproteobacteria bacterium]MDH3551200.1 homoserine O-acetyltransferase [Gammaproteobacteria bacterium]